MESIYDDTRCADCLRETNHQRRSDNNAEWYMVHKELWNLAIKEKPANFLCIGCLEKRIKRKLIPSDFLGCPLNDESFSGYGRSLRLRRRLGHTGNKLGLNVPLSDIRSQEGQNGKHQEEVEGSRTRAGTVPGDPLQVSRGSSYAGSQR